MKCVTEKAKKEFRVAFATLLCYNKSTNGVKHMGKYCKAYNLNVTYLDCMECETKECKAKQSEVKQMKKMYIELEPEQKVYLVYRSKKEGYKENIIIRCSVYECIIRKNSIIYYLEKEKIVTGKEYMKNVETRFLCSNANIDTGYRGIQTDIYPVFTSKEKCLEWLKDL